MRATAPRNGSVRLRAGHAVTGASSPTLPPPPPASAPATGNHSTPWPVSTKSS
ncbi:MAG: hypothetical protein LBK99_27320 [Opitutaceae bacterium]|nr:hypothetical protein [Opitutaceae bacterium]